jgi:hypothetical protein
MVRFIASATASRRSLASNQILRPGALAPGHFIFSLAIMRMAAFTCRIAAAVAPVFTFARVFSLRHSRNAHELMQHVLVMSAYPRKRTFVSATGLSAKGHKRISCAICASNITNKNPWGFTLSKLYFATPQAMRAPPPPKGAG